MGSYLAMGGYLPMDRVASRPWSLRQSQVLLGIGQGLPESAHCLTGQHGLRRPTAPNEVGGAARDWPELEQVGGGDYCDPSRDGPEQI